MVTSLPRGQHSLIRPQDSPLFSLPVKKGHTIISCLVLTSPSKDDYILVPLVKVDRVIRPLLGPLSKGLNSLPSALLEMKRPEVWKIISFISWASIASKHDNLVLVNPYKLMSPSLTGYRYIFVAITNLSPRITKVGDHFYKAF
jgi:hypothetical protein